jgi:hypothetical protein
VRRGSIEATLPACIGVLVDKASLERLSDEHLAAHGFCRLSRARLQHVGSGVRVDLLISHDPIPRRDGVTYPAPGAIESSPRDPDFLGLAPLLELKLWRGRYQDRADVVALLKRIDEGRCLPLEAGMPTRLGPELAQLRRDVLEELASGTAGSARSRPEHVDSPQPAGAGGRLVSLGGASSSERICDSNA